MPASETAEGVLCIELRIRMYHDGAMSKLLENLSKVRKRNESEAFAASFLNVAGLVRDGPTLERKEEPVHSDLTAVSTRSCVVT